MKDKKRVLIDCDPGIDDALALFFALASDTLKVEAVTAVYGNASVKQCADNLIKILHLSGLKKLPDMGIGSSGPLAGRKMGPRGVHGRDGLGGVDAGPINVEICRNDAVLLAVSKILSGKIDYIIATGPLTNIAEILMKERRVEKLVKGIYIMGGALFTEGNITPHAEFNIYNDPEAASVVFRSTIPKTLVSLDVTREVVLERGDLEGLGAGKKRLSRFIAGIADFSLRYNMRFRRAMGASLHDPLCVGVAARRDICSYGHGRIEIKLKGPERGRTAILPKNKEKGGSSVTYCRTVKKKMFKKLFLSSLKKLTRQPASR